MDFDVALAELGIEALERLDLLLGELNVPLVDRLVQPEQPVVAGPEVIADPRSTHPAPRPN